MAREINNTDDIIDTRDIIERLEELTDLIAELQDETHDDAPAEGRGAELEFAVEELATLQAFADEAKDYCTDYEYGETLIRDSYFVEYAQELAEDVGMLDKDPSWPYTCIDWAQAARELQMDYTSFDFDGVTYWGR